MRQGDLPGKGILAENNSHLFVIFKFVLAMTVNQKDKCEVKGWNKA